ncbi:cytochrome P450 [Podospora australis]|uniref:Cytochrome P450 n=1 Tax=Podospora australis TaxID=1536484 RepID=A0AAN7AEK8_9PEZI|nr:cytochrome P450 [Podospora australis]
MEFLTTLPLPTYLSALALLATLYVTTTILYNLFLHPLSSPSSFPGPLLNRATRLPYAYALATGTAASYTHYLHEKYNSPIIRLSPNHLSFTDPSAWRDIYGHVASSSHSSGKEEHAKSRTFYRALIPGAAPNILDADRDTHSRLRKALSHGFSERALRSQESRISDFINLLVSKLSAKAAKGEKVDMVDWYTWTTFDLTADLVFALSFGCLEKEEDHLFVKLNNEGLAASGVLGALYYLGIVDKLVDVVMAQLMKLATDFSEEMRRLLRHRLEEEGEKEDLFEGLVMRRDEWNLGIPELESNATVLVIAGADTTATQLSGVTYLLLTNPVCLAKVQKEVREAYSSPEEITLSTIDRLPYLVACMSEALRRYPPVTSNLVREVPGSGSTIAGKFIPPGTMVECQHWSMNHSRTNWVDPWAFRPERFLREKETDGGGDKGNNMESYNPFSTGPRNCIGRNLANAEMRLIFARLIYEFDMSLADEDEDDWIKKQKSFLFWEKRPLKVRLIPVMNR